MNLNYQYTAPNPLTSAPSTFDGLGIYEFAFEEWVGGAEPVEDFTREVDFRFMRFSVYESDRDMDRYLQEKTYLILVEPPTKWITNKKGQNGCDEVTTEVSIYIFRRGINENTSDKMLMQYMGFCEQVLKTYIQAVEYWGAGYIKIVTPADLTFHFGKTVNREVGVHANFKVTYY